MAEVVLFATCRDSPRGCCVADGAARRGAHPDFEVRRPSRGGVRPPGTGDHGRRGGAAVGRRLRRHGSAARMGPSRPAAQTRPVVPLRVGLPRDVALRRSSCRCGGGSPLGSMDRRHQPVEGPTPPRRPAPFTEAAAAYDAEATAGARGQELLAAVE